MHRKSGAEGCTEDRDRHLASRGRRALLLGLKGTRLLQRQCYTSVCLPACVAANSLSVEFPRRGLFTCMTRHHVRLINMATARRRVLKVRSFPPTHSDGPSTVAADRGRLFSPTHRSFRCCDADGCSGSGCGPRAACLSGT